MDAGYINAIFLYILVARLKQKLKEELIKQIMTGTSINKISKLLGLGKSTIYYYYKKIKGKKFKEPQFTVNASEIEGEIVGIFAGDGSQFYAQKQGAYQINVHFGIKHELYANHVKTLFEKYFNKKFWVSYEKAGRTIRIRTQSKKIFYYFSNYLEYIPQIKHVTVKLKTMDLPQKFKKSFLRGLFDTDGSILYNKQEHRVRISFSTTSSELIKQVKLILDELNFKYGFWIRKHEKFKDVYVVYLWKESTDRFLKEIRPFKAQLLTGR